MALLPTIEALGTSWWIEVFEVEDEEKAHVIYDDVRLFLATFEAKYSRFKADSLLTQLNTKRRITSPDPETLALLSLTHRFYTDTQGVFNPLVGQILEESGYDATYSFKAKVTGVRQSLPPDPYTTLSLSPSLITLYEGQLDLGGYGKGYLIDGLAHRLRTVHGLSQFLINGGGDMYATHHDGKPIAIYYEHPLRPGEIIAEDTLFNSGFAASSTSKRRWSSDGTTYSHIIDPVTGTSSTTDKGVYVKAPSTLLADVWATTLLLSPITVHQRVLARDEVIAIFYDPATSTFSTH